jgi:hypothetical protein
MKPSNRSTLPSDQFRLHIILSVGSTHFYVFFTGNLLGRFLRHCASAKPL